MVMGPGRMRSQPDCQVAFQVWTILEEVIMVYRQSRSI